MNRIFTSLRFDSDWKLMTVVDSVGAKQAPSSKPFRLMMLITAASWEEDKVCFYSDLSHTVSKTTSQLENCN